MPRFQLLRAVVSTPPFDKLYILNRDRETPNELKTVNKCKTEKNVRTYKKFATY